jgi:spore germination protein KC
MKKHLIPIICICLFTPLLSGCWDRIEVNDLAIVTAAAIDLTEDNQLKVSVQVFIPRILGKGGELGGGVDSTFVRDGIGSNLANAVSMLQMKFPRRIFWGQCKTFIFGRALAEKGIQESYDFLSRHPQPRDRAYIYISKGEAHDVLRLLPPLERFSGEVLKELSTFQTGQRITLNDLGIAMKNESQAVSLPLVEILPAEKGKKETETIPYLDGLAVLKKDRLIGTLDERKTRGVLWIRNEMKQYTISFKPEEEEGEISLTPVKGSVKLTPEVKKGQWIMFVKVKTEGDVVQNETNLNLANPKIIEKIEKDYQKNIKERIELSITNLQEELNADVVDFATEFHRKYPKEWKKAKDQWDEVFPEVKVVVQVEAYIRRPGYITTPGGLPENEVKNE